MSERQARPRRTPPYRVRAFVTATTLVAIGTGAVLARTSPALSRQQVLLGVVLALMIAVAHRFPVELTARSKITADTAPAFAAVLLLEPAPAIIASTAGILAGEMLRRSAGIQAAFNTAVSALRTCAGLAAFALVSVTPLTGEQDGLQAAVGMFAAACAMYAATTALLDAILSIQRLRSPWQDWWQRRRAALGHEGALFLTGALAAIAGARWPAAVLLVIPPTVLVYRSLRDGASLRRRTLTGLEDLAAAAEARIEPAAGHSARVAGTVQILAARLGLSATETERAVRAAQLQHLGLGQVRPAILAKVAPITGAEWSEIQEHPEAGARLLAAIPDMESTAALVLAHHERWDGKGYPQGLRGESIPLGARIIAVADAYHAMAEARPYRPALAPAMTREELLAGRGSQFDPAVVDALLAWLATAQQTSMPATYTG